MRKTLKMLALAFAVAAAPLSARALNPVTMEQDWDWTISQTVCTGATTCNLDVAALGSGISVSSLNVVGFFFDIEAIGTTGNLTISHIKKVYGSASTTSGFNNPSPTDLYGTGVVLSTSSTIQLTTSNVLHGEFRALTVNPIFYLTDLLASAKVYITVQFGRRK